MTDEREHEEDAEQPEQPENEGGNILRPDDKERAKRDPVGEVIHNKAKSGPMGPEPTPQYEQTSNFRRRKG